MCKFLSVGGNFQFFSKFLSFKGVSPRNEGQNLKKLEILEIWGVMKGVIYHTLSWWIMFKFLSVGWNFQIFVEILDF